MLEDDSREPRFVRTVSRHGYRFVFADVVEEDDESDWQDDRLAAPLQPAAPTAAPDPFEPLLQRITRETGTSSD